MRARLSEQQWSSLPILKVAADSGTHPPVALDRPVCVIGRHDGANLPLPAPQVSKVHALIVCEQQRVYLRDLASTNGVELNGEPVQETGLSDEDVIRIGSYTLRCASGFARQPAPIVPLPAAELRTSEGTFPFPTGRHTCLIGRREQCDIQFDDPSVAPTHAVLFEMDGRRYVQDLDSPQGTMLNGELIHRAELNPGDELRIGNVSLRYSLVEAKEDEADELITPVTTDSVIEPAIARPAEPAAAPEPESDSEPETPIQSEVSIDDSDPGDMPTFDLDPGEPEDEAQPLFDLLPEEPSDSVIPITQEQDPPLAPPQAEKSSPPSEASPPGGVDTQQITVLVEEVAEKAQNLKEAWDEYHSDRPHD